MSFEQPLKDLLITLLKPHGYTVTRLDAAAAPVGVAVPPVIAEPMEAALTGIRTRNHFFNTIIDIGASDGRWSDMALRQFPACSYLLIEAQPVHIPALQKFQSQHPNVQLALAAAGEKSGTINFDATDPFGGIASEHPFPANNIVIPITTLDVEVRQRNLKGPFLIKFDTHGYEVPILNGATETLAQTEVIIIECYNFKIADRCLLFHEMVAFLETKGFRCIDLVEPTRRPLDTCLWQMDLVFARNSRPEFSMARYQ